MKPLFTIHAGEFVAGDFIERNFVPIQHHVVILSATKNLCPAQRLQVKRDASPWSQHDNPFMERTIR